MPSFRKTALATLACALLATTSPLMARDAAPQAPAARQQAAKPGKVDPARLAEARKLVKLTTSDRMVQQILRMVHNQVAMLMVRMKPEKRKEILSIVGKITAEMGTGPQIQELRDEIARIYARELSLQDLKKLNEFYQTDTGRRFIEKMPSILAQSQRAGMIWGRKIGQELARRAREEAKKQGIDL